MTADSKICSNNEGMLNRFWDFFKPKENKFKSELVPSKTSDARKNEKPEQEKNPESQHTVDPQIQSTLDYKKDNRWLRKFYAYTAVALATISISFWIVFVSYIYICNGYIEGVHTEKVLAIITTACTINILTAFVSITKGLFFNFSNKK